MARKRSITDKEISLIKAMAARSMKNKDIQFFFNRPDRSVNSGRITGIKTGAYSDSAKIAPANDNDLDTFLAAFKKTDVSASVSVPASNSAASDETGPMAASKLQSMFKKNRGGTWLFIHGESNQHECKEDFGFKHAEKWLRAVAALANNSGGYVLFGVKDKSVVSGKIDPDSYKVTGMKGCDFEIADPADFTKHVKSTFDPTPRVDTTILEIDGMKVGIMHVHQHGSRPVIAQKSLGSQVKEGDIFFRYPGQSARIKYSDLRTILDERDRQARQQILPMVEKLLHLGPREAMVTDLSDGKLSDDKRSIIIGEDLLDKIKFIREGEFDEKEGEPTLRLVGDVQKVSADSTINEKGFVTPADLVRDFLEQKAPYAPKEYVRCAVEGGNGAWLPMHFFASKAGMSRKQLSDFISATEASAKRKEVYCDRASGKKSAYSLASGSSVELMREIEARIIPKIETKTQATAVARAVGGLSKKPETELTEILRLMKSALEIVGEDSGARSQIRRAISRVDELFFANE